jgi:type I restriction enzyme S subunit
LGEHAEIVSGITKGRRLNGKPTREVPYLTVYNVQDRALRLDQVKTIEATEDEIERYRLKKDDLLLTEGGDPDKLGRGTLWNDELPESIHQNHIFRVRLRSSELDAAFLNWLVGSERGKRYFLRSAKQTTGIASINMGQLRSFPLLLPPLAEQRRIAAILDAADALRQKRRQVLRLLDQLTQAIFVEMFGDPASNIMAWPTASLDEMTEASDRINYGVVQPGEDVEDGVPLIRVADLMQGEVRDHGLKRILPSIEANYSRSRLKGDEILIACVGSIGTVALATPDVAGANIARAVARVRVDKQKAERRFVAEQLKTSAIQRYFQNEIRVVAQPTLNIKQIKETPMIVPPLRDQERYCKRTAVVDQMVAAAESSLAGLDRLFASLQHRAFRGEL